MKHAREDYNRIQDPDNKIPADEPVFLLRGQDAIAPLALRLYALKCLLSGVDEDIVIATLQQAKRMNEWPKKKLPDM